MTEGATSKKNTGIAWLFLLLPIGWLCALHPNDLARIICGVVIILCFIPKVRQFFSKPIELNRAQTYLLLFYVIAYPLVISLHHLFRMYCGGEGFNVAHFTNVINNFSVYKSLLLTVDRDKPYNHLLHHFSPVLYLPASLTLIGIPGYLAFVLSELFIMAALILIFKKILSYLGYSKSISLIFIVLLISNYSLRHSFNWGIEDEFFAVPFILMSYYFFLRKKPWLTFVSLLLCCTVKESMFLYSFFFCAMVILIVKSEKSEFKKYNPLFISWGIVSLILFSLYIWGQPFLFGKTFDHISKAGSVSSLLDFNSIKDKISYLFFLLLPFLFFPILNKKSLIWIIPALPFIMLSMVSNVKGLYDATDYYSVLPVTVFAAATVIELKNVNKLYLTQMKSGLAIILICISFFLSGWKPTKVIINSIGQNYVTSENFKELPKNSTVMSTESLVPFLVGFDKLKFYYEEKLNEDYDFFIMRENEKEMVPESFRSALVKDEKLSSSDVWVFRKKTH